jgi:SagB-type dehydrogenase family enzyme
MNDPKVQTVLRYHEETKHHTYRSAKSLGYMDWENQPNPFRFYEGAQVLQLPLNKVDPEATYSNLYERARKPVGGLTLKNISLFLELALGISAWKSIPGARWALRMNPSSGNLHPTEGYVIVPEAFGLGPGIYHYSPFLHALECRGILPTELADLLRKHFCSGGFFFALTSIFWREAWKYGERAFRYCNHDMGHAVASISFAANLLGWKVSYLSEVADEDLSHLLGFHKTRWVKHEEEYPEALCYVHPLSEEHAPRNFPDHLISKISEVSFQGTPNRLSEDHVNWEIISETAKAVQKSAIKKESTSYSRAPLLDHDKSSLTASKIIRQRRSAVAFDGKTSISKNHFLMMLKRTLPHKDCAPFDFELGLARIHLLLFVHRVTGLFPGLYMFVRNDEDLSNLKSSTRPEFSWKKMDDDLPLYLLAEGLLMREATAISCNQDIAGDGAFSLGMIAKFRDTIQEAPFLYRHLFWESGMIGQILYLEAEARNIRGTGIGCFFDDSVHQIMGLRDNTFQSLYHFTVGGPVEDSRLQTWPSYFHLKNNMTDPGTVIHFDPSQGID